MRHMKKMLALVLVFCTLLSICTMSASASSIADGSKTCTVAPAVRHTYLTTTAGTSLGASGYTYTTNDGLTGPAYCIDHGLAWTGKSLPITGKYHASPATAGVFANGYPQFTVKMFQDLYMGQNAILEGLTEEELRYSTQVAVWASLGQIAVDGTKFTQGRERLAYPAGGTTQQMRVFRAIQLMLGTAANWDRVYQTGMYIRLTEDQLGGNEQIPPDMTLEYAAEREQYGIKREIIGGKAYYTKEYVFASATSTYWNEYSMELWADGAPDGTIFVTLGNQELPRSHWRETSTWRVPTTNHNTNLNSNGFEYYAKAKLCIPVDAAPNKGEITVRCAANIMQYEIFLAENETSYEQSYIIADPSKGQVEAKAVLSWGSDLTEQAYLHITKVGGSGAVLPDAEFRLTGSDGSTYTATTDQNGEIFWSNLKPDVLYTLDEVTPPAGYSAVEPIQLTLKAARVEYITVKDNALHTLSVRKIDKQTGYSLRGATLCFEQIDGSFRTTATTDHAGFIQFDADELPLGSYKIYEVAIEGEGYEVDPTPQTVHWDGTHDVTLTFSDVRKPTLIISKQSSQSRENLPGASFKVFRDGQYVTTVTTNDAGLAYVHNVASGSYYEVVEEKAPEGHLLNSERHGIYIDAYDPATTDDPRIVVLDDPLPSLRILKYDRTSHKGLPHVTFEVFRDGVSLGNFETDRNGEILLSQVEPGTYLAVERDTGGDTHILTATPQEVELQAGDGVRELLFFNDRKPGLWLVKVDSDDPSKGIPNAVFEIKAVDGSYGPKEFTTDRNGEIDLSKLPATAMVVTEKSCPGYVIDDAQRIIQLQPNSTAQFVFTNHRQPSVHLIKRSADGTPLAGVTYRLTRIEDGSRYLERTTSTAGEITWEGLEPGVYSLVEVSTLPTHILDETEYHVELFPGKVSEVVLTNDRRPNLTIHKTDADDGVTPVPDTVFVVKAADGSTIGEYKTGADGTVTIPNLLPQVVEISEKTVPSPYLKDAEPQLITLYPNQDSDAYFQNHKAPIIEIFKENAITKDPISNVKFRVWYASNQTASGELNDLGLFTTDEAGRITLTGPDNGLKDGWFRVQEVEPAPGFALADPDTQEAFVPAGKSHTFRFSNMPLSAICVWKYDSQHPNVAIEGAVFQIRYLSGNTSGTGGTVIGTYRTSANGSFTATGLQRGTYIIEELSSDGNHVIDTPPQTVYLSGEEQEVIQVYFGNSSKGSLLVKKVSASDGTPLSDVEFLVTTSDGAVVGNANGKFVTDSAGSFTVSGIEPGTTLIVKETRAKSGYLLDDTPQTVQIKAGQTVTLEFRNKPLGSLIIHKLSSDDKKTPLAGVQFKITYADGKVVDAADGKLSSNGLYWTNSEGQIILSGITGTVIVTEVASIPGFSIDPNTQSQTVVINPDDTQHLYFYNAPVGGVEIVKVNAANTSQRIGGVTFEIRRLDDALVKTVTTGKDGRAYVSLEAGSYYAVETGCPSNFRLDSTPHYFEVKEGVATPRLTITNQEFTGILIHKVDSVTGCGIPSVTFLVYDGKMNPIDQVTTDQNGYAYIEDLGFSGKLYLRELEVKGYVLDTALKTVYAKAGETVEITWKNTPITGQIQIWKKSADDNAINGFPAGTPLSGAVFEIYDKSNRLVDTVKSDSRGLAVSKLLPLGRYTVKEVTSPAFYSPAAETTTVYLEHEGQIVQIEVLNKSVYTHVSVQKSGYTQVVPGQSIRYTFKEIGNNSTVPLDNFFWRDTLPTDAVRLDKITTGTWSAKLTYKVVFRTNINSSYRTLADNLDTQRNYTLDASPAALGLASNEYITETMCLFGRVPAGFKQMQTPYIYCNVLPGLAHEYRFTNKTDVGGTWQGQWIMANDRWVTIVYKGGPTPTLPRTGF